MSRILVGAGLVTMLSAVAFLSMVAGDTDIPVSVVNTATATSVWAFLGGCLLSIVGGLQGRRR